MTDVESMADEESITDDESMTVVVSMAEDVVSSSIITESSSVESMDSLLLQLIVNNMKKIAATYHIFSFLNTRLLGKFRQISRLPLILPAVPGA